MHILLVGLNHKTAPVKIRERIAFDADGTFAVLGKLKERWGACEFILLSTCNRVELYCAIDESSDAGPKELAKFLAEDRGVEFEDMRSSLYVKRNEACVRHLLTVTSSLDSMVIGENQINVQVKDSYKAAVKAGSAGKVLSHLFHVAFSTSKSVFTQTSIASGRTSVAGVAVELASQLFEDMRSSKVVVLGAGEMGQLLVEHFQHVKCEDITIVNRSYDRGCSVAGKHDVAAVKWEELEEQLIGANIVVGAAAASDGYLFDRAFFKKIMRKRGGRMLLIVDITVPRSFDPEINKIEDTYLYCIDDLSQVVDKNMQVRADDVELAIEIICGKVSEFMDWFDTMDIGPLIGRMKNAFYQVKQEEMDKFFVGPRSEACCKDTMNATVHRVVNKLLHCVIKNINTVAKEKGAGAAAKLAKDIVEHAEFIVGEDNNQENN
ncbi:MAG: glutamyl-tRNA reductase [Anaerohalosphaera sp.]|nr:glutamyl-tRNA reductase [Anaerohalosphaera sp.]